MTVVGKFESARFVESLAAEYGRDLLRFIARRARSSADAGDIAQETYVRLLRFDRKDLIRDPRPYLYRIAANVLYEAELKRRGLQPKPDTDNSFHVEDPNGFDLQISGREMKA